MATSKVAYKVGDALPMGAVLPGLSPEQLIAMASKVTPEQVDFEITYYGVFFGTGILRRLPTGDIWELN